MCYPGNTPCYGDSTACFRLKKGVFFERFDALLCRIVFVMNALKSLVTSVTSPGDGGVFCGDTAALRGFQPDLGSGTWRTTDGDELGAPAGCSAVNALSSFVSVVIRG